MRWEVMGLVKVGYGLEKMKPHFLQEEEWGFW